MTERNLITVTQLNSYISGIFKAEEMLHNIEVKGEVSGYKVSGAHAYFTLKDENASISCCCFFYTKTYKPKDGESIICKGSPDFYVKGGRLSFNVSAIEPAGKGELYMRIEQLKQKLKSEGVFDEAHKVPIPKYARDICVITARTGAVIRDIVTTARKKNPLVNIVLKNVKVQGDGASVEISSAIKAVDKLGFDTIILARGGGSLEDLLPFYDERVVRAIYDCETPIISAVGHETDFSLSDMAADQRAATPTAAAEIAVYDYFDTVANIVNVINRMQLDVSKQLEADKNKLKLVSTNLTYKMNSLYEANKTNILSLNVKMKHSIDNIMFNKSNALEKAIGSLDNLNPLRLLKSGYFRLQKDKQSIFDIKNLHVGDKLTALGGGGTVEATVDKVIMEENYEV